MNYYYCHTTVNEKRTFFDRTDFGSCVKLASEKFIHAMICDSSWLVLFTGHRE